MVTAEDRQAILRQAKGCVSQAVSSGGSWPLKLHFLLGLRRGDFFPQRRAPEIQDPLPIHGPKEIAVGRERRAYELVWFAWNPQREDFLQAFHVPHLDRFIADAPSR